MSCGVGCRRSSNPELLWLWRRPVATAPIQPLAWEPPYAAGEAQEIATTTTTTKTKRPKKRKKKINKKTQLLNDTLDQMNLIDIHRLFHPKAAEYTFFSHAHRTFSRIGHILGHKSSLGKFKKTEIISRIFSNHNAK